MKYILSVLIYVIACVWSPMPGFADIPRDYLTTGEYFFDNDPGEGNGYPVIAYDGTFDEATELVDYTFDLPVLTSGPHYLYLRFRNSTGIWGIANRYLIVINNDNQLITGEYFFDTDPGVGNGKPIDIIDGSVAEQVLLPDNIEEGLHDLYLRMKDSEGSWGPSRKSRFEVTPWLGETTITEAEYYIDEDPGAGNGSKFTAENGAFDEAQESFSTMYRTALLAEGTHTLYVRAKDSAGEWTLPATTQAFTVTSFDGLTGDIDGNKVLNLKDAVLALLVLSGQQPAEVRSDYVSSGVDVDNWQVGFPEVLYILETVSNN